MDEVNIHIKSAVMDHKTAPIDEPIIAKKKRFQ